LKFVCWKSFLIFLDNSHLQGDNLLVVNHHTKGDVSMKKHTLISFLLVLVTASLLFGAGVQEQAAPQAPQTVLEFWTWRPEDVDFYAKQIALFEAANPTIKVVQTAHKNTEYNTILAAALSGGAGPDVFQGRAYGGLATFADSGFLEPLEAWMPELKKDRKSVV
jgi:raffinose/stachyose/melibiose transport system substrate-binding protein